MLNKKKLRGITSQPSNSSVSKVEEENPSISFTSSGRRITRAPQYQEYSPKKEISSFILPGEQLNEEMASSNQITTRKPASEKTKSNSIVMKCHFCYSKVTLENCILCPLLVSHAFCSYCVNTNYVSLIKPKR